MNGNSIRKTSISSNHDRPYGQVSYVQPSSKVLLDGYSGELGHSQNGGQRTNEQKGVHARASGLLNPNDPISMHLLMETAIGDSQQYDVLSVEEVQDLKQELAVVSSRIDTTKQKLALESKVRDAATSLNRLQSSNDRESRDRSANSSQSRHRRLMSKGSGSDLVRTDSGLAASNKKCEELAQELWRLEKRSQELQTQLLEHTAGVLQMTHKGFLDKDAPSQEHEIRNGHVSGFNDMGLFSFGQEFDDRSFYSTLDAMVEPDRGQGENLAFAQHAQSILETERKLWKLNRQLQDAIFQASSGRSTIPAPPDPETSDAQDPEHALQDQISYLEEGFDTMQQSHIEAVHNYEQLAHATEENLEDLSNRLREVILRSSFDQDPQYPLPPDISGRGPEGQVAFLEAGIDALAQSILQQRESHQTLATRSAAHEEKVGHYEDMVQSLWTNIGSGERYSKESFSTTVLSFQTRLADLQEQKDILKRQIEQQRELNSESDTQKDARLAALTVEVEQNKGRIQQHQGQLDQSQSQLEQAHSRLEQLESQLDQSQSQLEQAHSQLEHLGSQLEQAQIQFEQRQNQVQQYEDQLAASEDAKRELSAKVEEKSVEADRARKEMENIEGEMVRLQTEVTVARAELDGAYGTRAQRAAEVAQHPALQGEISKLNDHNAALQKELSETIGEYEVMTKSSIEFEKERENLENAIDNLRDRCENLETQVSEEKVRMLGIKSPSIAGDRGSTEKGATSTAVLKNEFKKMMRETRAENMKALRAEQDERRKLEAQVRQLRREQAPGKSTLSQSMTAA